MTMSHSQPTAMEIIMSIRCKLMLNNNIIEHVLTFKYLDINIIILKVEGRDT